MRDEVLIECHPPRAPLWRSLTTFVGATVIFGGLIFMGLFMASESLTNHQTTQETKFALFAIGLVLALALLIVFVWWEQDRWYWALTEDHLIGGRKRDKPLPLSSVQMLVCGLPDTTNVLVTVSKVTHPDLYSLHMAERKLALLLKFSDGSFMPFHVHRCVNGSQFMTELLKRLGDRFVGDYEYTSTEISALKSADWNKLIHPRS